MRISTGARLVNEQDIGVGGVGGLGPAEATMAIIAWRASAPDQVPSLSGPEATASGRPVRR